MHILDEYYKKTDIHKVPQKTLDTLNVNAADISDKLKNDTMPLTSMSLLNPGDIPTRHVLVISSVVYHPAYLFSLAPCTKGNPRVLRVSEDDIKSGFEAFKKTLDIHGLNSEVPTDLKKFYNKFKTAEHLKRHIAGNTDNSLTYNQLDVLSKAITIKNTPYGNNEVIAAVTLDHVKGLFFPFNFGIEKQYPGIESLVKLCAALQGIQHINATPSLDVPILYWNSNSKANGELFYLGQGKDMLTNIAMVALRDLSKTDIFNAQKAVQLVGEWESFRNSALRNLSIDISEPIKDQTAYKKWVLGNIVRNRAHNDNQGIRR